MEVGCITPFLILCLFISCCSSAVFAAEPHAGLERYPGLEQFFDAVFNEQINNRNFVGVAVSVVKDGRQIFAKGYGFADLERNIPVNPQHTLFRIGSVSKLFTWTAVMQLVEQGKINLHEDINSYLDFTIVSDHQENPITMWHLMTHTAGFADSSRGMLSSGEVNVQDLGAYLVEHIPTIIYPPGHVTAYSNYGTALAGYILERITGKPYKQVIEELIFQPLRMTTATLQQPVPSSGEWQVATGYAIRNQAPVPQPFENIRLTPTGGISGSVTDMSNFMIAHLQNGRFGEIALLGETTIHEMHAIQFRNDPRLTGMALGFYQVRVNGRLFLTHAGDTTWFSSQMYLLPEENLGIFVSYNSTDTVGARQQLIQSLCDRYYPEVATAGPDNLHAQQAEATVDVEHITGLYLSTRRPVVGIEKLRQLIDPFYQPIKVTVDAEGALRMVNPSTRNAGQLGNTTKWDVIEPGLYQQVDERDRLAFRKDAHGQVYMLRDSQAPRAYQKLSGWEEILYSRLWVVIFLLGFAGLLWVTFHTSASAVVTQLTRGVAITGLLTLVTLGYFGLCQFTAYLNGITPFSLRVITWLLVLNLLYALGLMNSLVIGSREGNIWVKLPYMTAVALSGAFQYWAWFWQLYHPV
jgi:CubicO group peptidase (beta-lactamase class C family)